MNKRLLL